MHYLTALGNVLGGLASGNLNVLNPVSSRFAGYQLAGGAIMSAQIAAGIVSSLASADAFMAGQVANDGSQVHYVNGVLTNRRDAETAALDVAGKTEMSTQLVYNPTAGPLDLVQAVFEGLGAISPQSLNIADMITGGATNWVGFSQGTRVIAGGISAADPGARSQVNFQGFGGQANVTTDTYRINSSRNVYLSGDVVAAPWSPAYGVQPTNWTAILLSNQSREREPGVKGFDHQFSNYYNYIKRF
jgi:hypothetical protein